MLQISVLLRNDGHLGAIRASASQEGSSSILLNVTLEVFAISLDLRRCMSFSLLWSAGLMGVGYVQ